VLLFCFLFTISCSATFNEAGNSEHAILYSATYHFSLQDVQRPGKPTTSGGTSQISNGSNDNHYHSSFEDSPVKDLWGLNSRFINCSIINKTDSTIRVLWDDALYDDERKAAHPLGPVQATTNRELGATTLVILKDTFFEESLYPSDYPFTFPDPIGGSKLILNKSISQGGWFNAPST
jgi:hypothetical protein